MATAKIIFLSPCLLECYFQSKTKIEPDLRLAMIGKKAKIDPLRSASEATVQRNTSQRAHKEPYNSLRAAL